VNIGIPEAVLGGRVQVQTPGGTVRITIPPGTDSGTRLRLRGKGKPGPGGEPADLYVELRIVVPKQLDPESRGLIERFGELNPLTEE
jgi:curved DNA-binding protein